MILGVVIADAQTRAEASFGSMELRAASRVCALSSTVDIFLVLVILHSPFDCFCGADRRRFTETRTA